MYDGALNTITAAETSVVLSGWDTVRCGGTPSSIEKSMGGRLFFFNCNGQCHFQYDTSKHIISSGGYSPKILM